jgi:hypothetical protein
MCPKDRANPDTTIDVGLHRASMAALDMPTRNRREDSSGRQFLRSSLIPDNVRDFTDITRRFFLTT